MAKKKQRKKVYRPPPPKLETQFNCPECCRKKVVEVHFNKRENKGYLRCRACGEEYEGKMKRASMPIDIYYDWINHRDQEKEKENNYENDGKEEEGLENEFEEGENNEDEEQQENDDYEGEQEDQNKEEEEDDNIDGEFNEEEGSEY